MAIKVLGTTVIDNSYNLTNVFSADVKNLSANGNVILNSITYPTTDGSSGQALVTNGTGTLSFGSAGVSTGKAIAMAIVFG